MCCLYWTKPGITYKLLTNLSECTCGAILCQVMVKQEIYRKLGYAIQADEEQLRVQLEAL